MGVEEGGPSKEDLKVRPGEPEERIQNIDEAHDLANQAVNERKMASYERDVAANAHMSAEAHEEAAKTDIFYRKAHKEHAKQWKGKWGELRNIADERDEKARKIEEE